MIHRLLFLCSILLLPLSVQAQSSPVPGQTATNMEVARLKSKVEELERKVKTLDATGIVLFLFGIFCALWAQNTGRNAWLWFFLGLFGSMITVVVLLLKNSDDRFRESLRVKLR